MLLVDIWGVLLVHSWERRVFTVRYRGEGEETCFSPGSEGLTGSHQSSVSSREPVKAFEQEQESVNSGALGTYFCQWLAVWIESRERGKRGCFKG